AYAAGGGSVTFECVANLPEFPSAGNTGSCGSGTIAGVGVPSVAVAALAGAAGTTPFAVAGAGSLSASFDYSEGCVAGEPPVLGTAIGTATATIGGPAGGSLTTDFSWTRVGLTAVILTSNGTVTTSGGTSDDGAIGVGVAAFVPLLDAGNTCPTGGDLTAIAAGELIVADAS
ncbi:MAG: hypothetical protein ACRDJI_06130, partial [Actinomycetota bacterium]